MKIIVVTGTPGTGKTTFSKSLSNKLGLKYIDLNKLLIENKCYSEFDRKRGSYVVNLDKGRKIFRELSGMKYIIDSHVSHLIVPKELIEICFVLRASPYVLIDRLRRVGFKEENAIENCSAEILDIILIEALNRYGKELVCELDSTNRSVNELIEEALKVLSGKAERRVGMVNWLKEVYDRGDLRTFFK